jgi:hypothetical protein
MSFVLHLSHLQSKQIVTDFEKKIIINAIAKLDLKKTVLKTSPTFLEISISRHLLKCFIPRRLSQLL